MQIYNLLLHMSKKIIIDIIVCVSDPYQMFGPTSSRLASSGEN